MPEVTQKLNKFQLSHHQQSGLQGFDQLDSRIFTLLIFHDTPYATVVLSTWQCLSAFTTTSAWQHENISAANQYYCSAAKIKLTAKPSRHNSSTPLRVCVCVCVCVCMCVCVCCVCTLRHPPLDVQVATTDASLWNLIAQQKSSRVAAMRGAVGYNAAACMILPSVNKR